VKSVTSSAPPGKRSGNRTRPRVLIVDDDRDNRDIYAQYLRYSGWAVVEAKNGEEALELAMATLPAAIVMDVVMPVLGGIEATRRLKKDPRSRRIPILVLTSSVEASDSAIKAGCDAYLEKPCLPNTLLGILEQLVFEKRAVTSRT
jgi:CheY-like chemotaxis protein